MKANTAGQIVVAQLVSATDGSAVTTGTTTVSVLVDGGTQAAGTGTVAHEGGGCWSYAPSAAETNGSHIAFTFANSAAISVTVQVYTTFPQTGDSFARLGAPAGASVSADIATVDGIVDAILVDTAEIGAAGAGLTEAGGTGDHLTAINLPDQTMNITGNLSGSVGSVTGNVGGNVTGSIGSLAAQAKSDVNAEVVDVLTVDIIPELTGDPGATPTFAEAVMLPYMGIRNKRDTTATSDEIHNDIGTVILTATLSDDGTTFSKSEYA